MTHHFRRWTLLLSALCATAGFTPTVFASAFQLWEQNSVGTGDAHAGGAAQADDASTAFYNPAGMIRIPNQQVMLGTVLVTTHVKFKGSVYGNSGVANGGIQMPIPNFHYVAPLSDYAAVGLSIVSPFGLATNYNRDSIAASYATKTTVKDVLISPALAFKLTQKFSIGAGLDLHYLTGEFNNSLADVFPDNNSGSDHNYGWHAGLLYQFTDATRVGVAYHYKVRLHISGKGSINDNTVPDSDRYGHIYGNLTLPATTTASVFHSLNKKIDLLASVSYTQWNVFQSLELHGLPDGLGNIISINVPNYYSNTWNYAVGTHYHFNDQWLGRFGLAYDQTPSNNAGRNLRLPDQSRFTVAAGAGYQILKQLAVDLGWSHVFVRKGYMNNTVDLSVDVTTTGSSVSSADILGLQFKWDLDNQN